MGSRPGAMGAGVLIRIDVAFVDILQRELWKVQPRGAVFMPDHVALRLLSLLRMTLKKTFFSLSVAAFLAGGVTAAPDPVPASMAQPSAPEQVGSAVHEEQSATRDEGPLFLRERRQESPDALSGFSPLRPLVSILAIILVLFFTTVLLKRRRGLFAAGAGERKIKILERCTIDHRRSLVLVEVDGHRVLVGISPERMDSMMSIQDWEPVGDEDEAS